MIYKCTAFLSFDFDITADSLEEAKSLAYEHLDENYNELQVDQLFID